MAPGGVAPPLSEIDEMLAEQADIPYELKDVKAPRLAGLPLKLFAWAVESSWSSSILPKLKRDSNIPQILNERDWPDEPTFFPAHSTSSYVEESGVWPLQEANTRGNLATAVQALPAETSSGSGFQYWKIRDYANAYSTGSVTPVQVAERFIAAIEASQKQKPALNFLIAWSKDDILRQAEASKQRYAQGAPLSVLDGVPIAIKDEIDCLPHKTTGGTTWLADTRPVKEDAAIAARLKEAGALIVGKANMHEVGSGTFGINPHYGSPRNPHNPAHVTGGSSAGSAALVAAGLVPVALGVDGGGSVRIPASLCGIVGLKGTFGRVPVHGHIPITNSVGMSGPLAASVEDALIVYAAIAGPHPGNHHSLAQPAVRIPRLSGPGLTSLANVRIGRYQRYFEHADPEVVQVCTQAVRVLENELKAQFVDVVIPELEELRVGWTGTFPVESFSFLNYQYEHGKKALLGYDVRINSAVGRSFSGLDYVNAQKLRTRSLHHWAKVLEKVDIIVTPTSAKTAPLLKSDALATGDSDLTQALALTRFVVPGNFLGLPAISVPVGYDTKGLPVGLQLIGRPYAEATLLKVAAALEAIMSPSRKKPAIFYNLLSK
ncbi:Amidase family protein [Klebsormidium nitens]|uniref:Amidase family protein n=1 Tax=Klebsormidium nitens TaxID=105231 RepID=A0A1Y1HPS9_KLENI|nr:Amidase family protein [Klebsormidium nitens]|eukprot:GAQ78616.1 Amidase family protein [Klebsormidium nitens]